MYDQYECIIIIITHAEVIESNLLCVVNLPYNGEYGMD